MVELFGKSLIRSWSVQAAKWPRAAREKWLAGTVIFAAGVLLQTVDNVSRSPLLTHSRNLVGALMLLGLAIQVWALVTWRNDSSTNEKN